MATVADPILTLWVHAHGAPQRSGLCTQSQTQPWATVREACWGAVRHRMPDTQASEAAVLVAG